MVRDVLVLDAIATCGNFWDGVGVARLRAWPDPIAPKLQPLFSLPLYCFARAEKTLHNDIIVNKNVGVKGGNGGKMRKMRK